MDFAERSAEIALQMSLRGLNTPAACENATPPLAEWNRIRDALNRALLGL